MTGRDRLNAVQNISHDNVQQASKIEKYSQNHDKSGRNDTLGMNMSSFSVRDIINDTIEERISNLNNESKLDSQGYNSALERNMKSKSVEATRAYN